MPLIEDTLFGKVDKVQTAIDRIRSFDPTGYTDNPYYVAYSGGKDSDCIRILCELAGVKHELYHNHTTVDAPETVYYIRSIPNVKIEYPQLSMWKLIVKKKFPPLRIARYCCSELKERGGQGRVVMAGVRWEESVSRKNNRGVAEYLTTNKNKNLILNNDNDDSRRLFENCTVKGKRIINPIIDWTEGDVWEFLHSYGCESNPLYKCGYTRVGCIGCPMVVKRKREESFERYPTYKQAYIRAFDKMLLARDEVTNWKTGQDVFDWWINEKAVYREDINIQQSLYEES